MNGRDGGAGDDFGMGRQGSTSDHWIDELCWWMKARGYLGAT